MENMYFTACVDEEFNAWVTCSSSLYYGIKNELFNTYVGVAYMRNPVQKEKS